jgi:hypothetical protein
MESTDFVIAVPALLILRTLRSLFQAVPSRDLLSYRVLLHSPVSGCTEQRLVILPSAVAFTAMATSKPTLVSRQSIPHSCEHFLYWDIQAFQKLLRFLAQMCTCSGPLAGVKSDNFSVTLAAVSIP